MAIIGINFKDTSNSDDEEKSSSSGKDESSNETPSKTSNSGKSESEKSSGKSSNKSSDEATSGHSSDGKSSSSTSPSSNSKGSTDGNTSDSSSGNSSGNSGDSQKEKHTKRRSQRSVGQILKDEDKKGKKPVYVDLTLTDDEDKLENVKNSVDENEEAKKAKTKKIGEIMGKTRGNSDKEFKIRDYVKSTISKEDKEFSDKIRDIPVPKKVVSQDKRKNYIPLRLEMPSTSEQQTETEEQMSSISEQQTETEQAKGRVVGGYNLRATPQAPAMDDYHTTFNPLKIEKLPPKPKQVSTKPLQVHRKLEIRRKNLQEQNKLTEENTEKELSPALSVTNPELSNNQEIPPQVLPLSNDCRCGTELKNRGFSVGFPITDTSISHFHNFTRSYLQ
uniref:Uncharacterized protein n=1 Tax=Meloidogyne incognita TaxID=6306 RepID=A0A914LZY6_MELIC